MKGCLTAVVLTLALASGAGVSAEIIDRILAVVDGAIIMQSDVVVAERLGLVPAASAADAEAAALDRLVERQLILSEVDRYAPPDPPEAEVDRHVAEIRSRAGESFDAILRLGGISLEQLRRTVRDDMRIEAYLQQRFGAILPTDEEVLQYYRDHTASFSQNGSVRPFEEVRDAARVELIADRRAATIRDWLSGLRRRANINVLPR